MRIAVGPFLLAAALGVTEDRLRCTPVFAGTRVYVRTPEHLYCFGE